MKASILALGLYRSSGGPSKSVAAFQRALSADVVSWVDPVAYAREPLIWDGVKYRHYVVTGSSLPVLRQLCYPQRRGLAEAERIVAGSDLVSCHSFWRWHNVWLERVAALHRVPYWFVPHGALDPYVMESEMLVKRAFLSLGGRRFLTGARAVVCATQREYEKLAQLMPQARPVILPWPLDDADFRVQDAAQRAIVRNRLRIPADALVLLSFGRLHPMKRPLEIIVAFAAGAPPSAHLLVVGNECGVTAADCRTMAEKHGVAERVHLTGPAYGADKAGYLDAADVYVSLSHRENFNFTAAEALATGLPVILSPGNDLSPELEAADCGWLLASPDAAAEAMAALGGLSPEHISAKGERGRAWAEANLRYDVFATRLQEAAARLVASG
jgi:glycosyltransferase involved in cell wall biosynthesis